MRINEKILYKTIGGKIRKERISAGITQASLAQVSGLYRTTITNIEAGRQKAPLSTLYNVCSALNMELHTILPATDRLLSYDNKVEFLFVPPTISKDSETVVKQVSEDLHKKLKALGTA